MQPRGTAWTDHRAPVEWVTDRMLTEQIATGKGLHERYLPTAPRRRETAASTPLEREL
jgi:hypothetical protein